MNLKERKEKERKKKYKKLFAFRAEVMCALKTEIHKFKN